MSNLWFISDTHWSHSSILKFKDDETGIFTRPEFTDVNHMDECMMDLWNQNIKPQDKVWHFGDVFFGSFENYRDNIHKKLNGHKRLILGNHDKDPRLVGLFDKFCSVRRFDEFGFVGTHIPIHTDSCYSHRQQKQMINVCGHIHTRPAPTLLHHNICVERTGYKPLHIDELKLIVKQKTDAYEATLG